MVDREEWIATVPSSGGGMRPPREPGAEHSHSELSVERFVIRLKDHGLVLGQRNQPIQHATHRAQGAGTPAPMDCLMLGAPALLPRGHSTFASHRSDGRRDDKEGLPIDE